MKSLSQLVGEMVKERRLHIREPKSMSWGSIEQCKHLFIAIFSEVDKTIVTYNHLPEIGRAHV